jgi:hypothetical protein
MLIEPARLQAYAAAGLFGGKPVRRQACSAASMSGDKPGRHVAVSLVHCIWSLFLNLCPIKRIP